MIIKGKVHKFGSDINTDDIIAAKYLVTTDEKELGRHCMENIAPDFAAKVQEGDIIVADSNFGCGSSREHAPRALKGCGIKAVIARSFAGIFFRNAINVGLPFLESDQAQELSDGDMVEIDLSAGVIRNITKNETYKTEPFPKFLQDIVACGGLMEYIRRNKKCTKSR